MTPRREPQRADAPGDCCSSELGYEQTPASGLSL